MAGQSLSYRRREGRLLGWLRVVGVGIGVFEIVVGVVDHQTWRIVAWSLFTVGMLFPIVFRPSTEVSADGIRTAAVRRRWATRLAWCDVDAVVKPGPYDTTAHLILTDGSVRPVLFAQPSDASAIAEIGNKELRLRPAEPKQALTATPAPALSISPEIVQVKRKRSVSAEGERLRAELERIRRQR